MEIKLEELTRTIIVLTLDPNELAHLIDEIDTYVELYNHPARGPEWAGPQILSEIYNQLIDEER